MALLLTVVFAQNVGLWSTLVDDLSPSQKAAMRKNWHLEKGLWAVEKEKWGIEKARHQDEVAMWKKERDAFERESASWTRQRQDNRETFEREKAEQARQREEERAAFEREKEEREHQRQEEQKQWADQREQWARQRQEEHDAFEREKKEWALKRMEEDRHRRETEWRRRGAYWTEPWAASSQCNGYGTRSYSAHLLELPGDVNWLEACMDIPIRVNGRWIDKPSKCQRDVSMSSVG